MNKYIQYSIFFIVFLSVFAGGYLYLGKSYITSLGYTKQIKTILWIVSGVLVFLPILTIILQRMPYDNLLSNTVTWVGFLSFGLFTQMFLYALVGDAIFFLFKKCWILIQLINKSEQPLDFIVLGWYKTKIILVLSIGIFLYGLINTQLGPKIIEVSIPLRNLPSSMEGLKIVQISDLHIGGTLRTRFVKDVVAKVNSTHPDIIALTGDISDGTVAKLHKDAVYLKDLSAKLGKFYITGNHEYYSGAEEWIKELGQLNFTVLLNEHKLIEQGNGRLLMVGITDKTAGNFNPEQASDPVKALANSPSSDIKILLAHQPASIKKSASLGFDLMLSGHTHGGQFFPWNFLVPLEQPFVKGLHKVGNTLIYINQGTGFWGPPIRIGTQSEITLIRLTRE